MSINKTMKAKFLPLCAALIISALCPGNSYAGYLDSTFGDNGRVITRVGNNSGDNLNDVEVLPDGSILAAGSAIRDGINTDMMILKLKQDGGRDSSFGKDGLVQIGIGSEDDAIFRLAVQADGKIIAVGQSEDKSEKFWRLALIRFNSDGSLDETFGSKGIVSKGNSANDSPSAYDMMISGDGKILLAGIIYSGPVTGGDMMLLRYLPDGTPDSTFGKGGMATVDFKGHDYGFCMAIQEDGRILIGGSAAFATDSNACAMARFDENGVLDESFGSGGKVIWQGSSAGDMMITEDGKIVVLGHAMNNFLDQDFVLKRFSPDGTPDESFGKGMSIQDGHMTPKALTRLSDGRYLAAGEAIIGQKWRFILACYTADGMLDETFGKKGKSYDTLSDYHDRMWAMAVMPDERIVAGGTSGGPVSASFMIARYNIVSSTSGIEGHESIRASAYPNPSGRDIVLEYSLNRPGNTSLVLFDAAGNKIISFFADSYREPGAYSESLVLPGGLTPGMYLLTLSSAEGISSIKMALTE